MWPFTKHRPTSGDALSGGLRCSFCGQHQNNVQRLIAGPAVFICDKCIGLCNDIIAEELDERTEARGKEQRAAVHRFRVLSPMHSRGVSAPAICRFCGLPSPIQDVIAEPDRGFLCLVCLDIIRASSEEDSGLVGP